MIRGFCLSHQTCPIGTACFSHYCLLSLLNMARLITLHVILFRRSSGLFKNLLSLLPTKSLAVAGDFFLFGGE